MTRKLILTTILFALAVPALAAEPATKAAEPATKAAAPPAGLRAELLTLLDDSAKKVIELAEAVPQEKYAWRPSEGVRSMSEVFMHIAGGNYFLPTFLGMQAPADMTQEMEKETDKAKVVAALKKSYEHARKAIEAVPDAELEKKINLFGRDTTSRAALLVLVNHSHEHLGQAIAYARMNGVVPPWTAREPAGG